MNPRKGLASVISVLLVLLLWVPLGVHPFLSPAGTDTKKGNCIKTPASSAGTEILVALDVKEKEEKRTYLSAHQSGKHHLIEQAFPPLHSKGFGATLNRNHHVLTNTPIYLLTKVILI